MSQRCDVISTGESPVDRCLLDAGHAGSHHGKRLIWAASPVSESEPAARQFTIMCDWKLRRAGHDKVRSIPWSLIAPHEDCAKSNHGGQTLERLHERGGLCAAEALCVLKDLAWNRGAEGHRIASLPDADAQRELAELIVSAVSPSGGAPFPSDVMNGMTEHSKQSILRPGAPSPSGGAPTPEEWPVFAEHVSMWIAGNPKTAQASGLTIVWQMLQSERAARLVAETRVAKALAALDGEPPDEIVVMLRDQAMDLDRVPAATVAGDLRRAAACIEALAASPDSGDAT